MADVWERHFTGRLRWFVETMTNNHDTFEFPPRLQQEVRVWNTKTPLLVRTEWEDVPTEY